ncbi:hypothetical protein AAULR_05358, partial [Lacticaseibacillus rhamnosus MTCC 5462]
NHNPTTSTTSKFCKNKCDIRHLVVWIGKWMKVLEGMRWQSKDSPDQGYRKTSSATNRCRPTQPATKPLTRSISQI